MIIQLFHVPVKEYCKMWPKRSPLLFKKRVSHHIFRPVSHSEKVPRENPYWTTSLCGVRGSHIERRGCADLGYSRPFSSKFASCN